MSCHSGLTGETDPFLGASRRPIRSSWLRVNIFLDDIRGTVLLSSLGPTDSHDWFLYAVNTGKGVAAGQLLRARS